MPQTRVRWQGSTIEIYVPSEPRTVETTDVEVLQLLHHFSTPSRRSDVVAQFPDLPAESVETVVDELEDGQHPRGTARARHGARRVSAGCAPGVAGFGQDASSLRLPPNLNDYGQLDFLALCCLLASLAEQRDMRTDFLLACSSTNTQPSLTRAFVGPSRERLPMILFLE